MAKNIFTPQQRKLVCLKLAEGFTPKQVVDWAEEEFGVTCSTKNIYDNFLYSPRNKKRIDRFRRYIDRDLAKIPAYHKAWRLRKLQEAINEALTYRVRRCYYDKKGNLIGEVQEKKLGAIVHLVEELRKEIEGDKPNTEERQGLTLVDAGRLVMEMEGNERREQERKAISE